MALDDHGAGVVLEEADGSFVVRAAQSNGSDLLDRLRDGGVDAWTVIQHLAYTSHGGVRDYLINQMYEMKPEDIDFFLPQLCCFLVTWPESDRESLEQFMLFKCSKSLHCAMKMFWLLQAMAPYCTSGEQRTRCMTLATHCETVVINSCQPKFLGLDPRHLPTTKAKAAKKTTKVDDLLARSASLLQRIAVVQQRLGIAPASPSSYSRTTMVRSHSLDSFMALDPANAVPPLSLVSPDDERTRRTSSSGSSTKRFWTEDERELAAGSSFAAHRHSLVGLSPTSLGASIRDFDIFLAKQQMSEFFTAELHLIAELQEISNDLLRFEGIHRKLQLQRLVTMLNERACRGLYFPTGQATDRHYVILRILAQEVTPLSSREKVPFLMPVEIMYTGHDCSEDVHKEYFVDHESCRRYLLNLMEQNNNADYPLSPQGQQSTPSLSANSKCGLPFGELLDDRKRRIRSSSPFGRLRNWDLMLMIFKSGDDCRQEHLAMQMITYVDGLFRCARLPLRLHPLEILITSPTSGFIECVPDSRSIDSLKKSVPGFQSLLWFFEEHFGPRGSDTFRAAQKNFVESLAAYSLVCYLLQIKDRHNGNILLTNDGSIVHIDFGFMLSNSPGGNMNFERAPFKLTAEYVEVMEGEDSEAFRYFRLLMIRGFLELRQHCDRLVALAEILLMGPPNDCFYGGRQCLVDFRNRFHATDSEQIVVEFVYSLVSQSINNWRSVQYDTYQRITNGIL
ncbi:unnamed protein product (mitochondrion) [Plasmodiophora brassicae]|uniref:1-phosphatidylinositol 4-kinase n=1 Tax=Plasmodiophora brassicae TaxID=37360 RepID=A0A0G4J1A1_PLABS|nr:hypothetical protein PBRA_001952 [Plasmodiophora brassicae]SPR01372.1 unnamed protein product [Plasmodiophora brassicae]